MARELRSGTVPENIACLRKYSLRDFEFQLCEVPDKPVETVNYQDVFFKYLLVRKREGQRQSSALLLMNAVIARQMIKLPDISAEEKNRIASRILRKMKALKAAYGKISDDEECKTKLISFFTDIQGNARAFYLL